MIIGVTGKMGSGKSTASKFINNELPNSLYVDCDSLFKERVFNDPLYRKAINSLAKKNNKFFTNDVLDVEKFVAAMFNSDRMLEKINQVISAFMFKVVIDYIYIENKDKYSVFIIESSYMLTSPISTLCDKIFNIKLSYQERLDRVLKRDSGRKQMLTLKLFNINNSISENKDMFRNVVNIYSDENMFENIKTKLTTWHQYDEK